MDPRVVPVLFRVGFFVGFSLYKRIAGQPRMENARKSARCLYGFHFRFSYERTGHDLLRKVFILAEDVTDRRTPYFLFSFVSYFDDLLRGRYCRFDLSLIC